MLDSLKNRAASTKRRIFFLFQILFIKYFSRAYLFDERPHDGYFLDWVMPNCVKRLHVTNIHSTQNKTAFMLKTLY